MRHTKAFTLVLTGLVGLPLFLGAQVITREEFLDRVKSVHPIFEKEELAARIEGEDRASFLGARDWNVFSSLFVSHEEATIAIAGPEETDQISFEGGVEKAFWKTGGRLSASYSSFRTSMTIDPELGKFFVVSDAYYQNQFAVTYTHPLLRNNRGFLDRLEYDLKEYDIDFSEVMSFENREDFLAGTAQKFLDWVFLMEQERIIHERLKLSEEEFTRTERKRRAHLVEQADVIRAEDAVRFWKQNLMLVESQRKSLNAELAVISMNSGLRSMIPEFHLYEIVPLDTLDEAILGLEEKSRLIRAIDIRLRQLDHSRRGFEHTLKPDLSLVTQFNIKNADEGYGESWNLDKPDAVVGLQLSFPLGNRTTRHQITKTDLQIAQLEKELEDLTLTLVAALTDVYIQIRELEKVLELNKEQIESARQRTTEELKLYNQGRGELTFVIQSQDNEQNANLTYATNALTYHKLIVSYLALTDQLYN
jgi:outer membrane protein TolC